MQMYLEFHFYEKILYTLTCRACAFNVCNLWNSFVVFITLKLIQYIMLLN